MKDEILLQRVLKEGVIVSDRLKQRMPSLWWKLKCYETINEFKEENNWSYYQLRAVYSYIDSIRCDAKVYKYVFDRLEKETYKEETI